MERFLRFRESGSVRASAWSSTASIASKTLSSGSTSRFATEAAVSSLAVAIRASRSARSASRPALSLWFVATTVSDPAMRVAAAKTATRPRSRRADLRSIWASRVAAPLFFLPLLIAPIDARLQVRALGSPDRQLRGRGSTSRAVPVGRPA